MNAMNKNDEGSCEKINGYQEEDYLLVNDEEQKSSDKVDGVDKTMGDNHSKYMEEESKSTNTKECSEEKEDDESPFCHIGTEMEIRSLNLDWECWMLIS